jgi:nucleotide-binding universal stress UspA family protein
VSRRVLVAVLPGDEATALDRLGTVVSAAPQARVRVACLRPLPPPRRDRHDRVVADADVEMERIARDTAAAFHAAARALEHTALEIVVRFGIPTREVATEADAFAPDLVVLFASPRSNLLRRWRGRRLRQHLSARPGIQLLVVDMPRVVPSRALPTPAAAASA